MPPVKPVPSTPAKRPSPRWDQIRNRANTIASIAALFLFLVLVGSAVGYFYATSHQKTTTPKSPTVQNLSADDLKKLSEIGANLGTTGQVLNIGAAALFRGQVDVGGDLSIGGHLNANGPVTLSQLNITGTTAATGLSVGSNLTVGGATTLQKSLTVNDLVTINAGLNVSGAASINSLNASSIAVHNISISGPLTIGHLSTQGPAPTLIGGTALGSGGTVSISGNDTAGTINLNTGSTPPPGVLGTVTFRASYTTTVHVLLSPLTAAAAATPAYITRNNGGFQIHTDANPPAGSALDYDYLVVQ